MISTSEPRLAVLLPHAYLGGTLRLLMNVVRHAAAQWPGPVVLAVPAGHRAAVGEQLEDVRRDVPGLDVRELHWKHLEPPEARAAAATAGLDVGQWISSRYQVPTDGGADFADCDFWLFISDRLELPLVPLRPYGVFVTDHLQRYVPEVFDAAMYANCDAAPWNFLRNVRNADLVVASSEETMADVVSYAGALGRRVRVPTTIDVDHFVALAARAGREQAARPVAAPFFAWVTNPGPHKNHLRMLQALADYYCRLDGRCDTVVTGLWTELFDPDLPQASRRGREAHWSHPYIAAVREAVGRLPAVVRQRIRFMGSVPDVEYVATLQQARFVVHNVIADNGTFSVVEAALLGRPAVSSDYPQMREIAETFGLGLRFFDPFDARDTALALHDGETLPPPVTDTVGRRIRDRSWQSWDKAIVDAVRATLQSGRRRIACL